MKRADKASSHELSLERRRAIAREIVAPVRAYPEQWALAKAILKHPQVAVRKNRRAGGTEGVGRLILGRCIAEAGFSCSILTKHLAAPTINWLERAGVSAMSLIRDAGLAKFVRVSRQAGSIKRIVFPWPEGDSEIRVYELGHEQSIEKIRGSRAHVYWPDEMQSIEHAPAAIDIVLPTLADFEGHIVATGTPGKEVDSYFRRITDGTEPQWHRVELFSWDNPAFGAMFTDRWRRILDTAIAPGMARFGLTTDDLALMRLFSRDVCMNIALGLDDLLTPLVAEWLAKVKPTLLREYFGRWVVASEEYVYDWYARDPADLYFCRATDLWSGTDAMPWGRTMAERVDLLPMLKTLRGWRRRDWRAVIGHDIGTYPDPAAWVIWAYTLDHPRAYEIWSEKLWHLGDAEMFARSKQLIIECEDLGIRVTGMVADVKGMRAGTGIDWDRELKRRIPDGVRRPRHNVGPQRILAFNIDLASGVLGLAAGSPLDVEGRHLRYRLNKAGNPEVWTRRPVALPDGTVLDGTGEHQPPGDHCLDASLYALDELRHIWGREPERPAEPVTVMEEAHRKLRAAEAKPRSRARGARA
jgi:hypothetical protein